MKCGCGDVIETRGRNAYCETCFLTMTSHKFRATLGKSKIIRKGDSVLVAYSGKPNATMLIHLIKSGNEQSAHKKLIFKTKLLYVDDGAIQRFAVERRSSVLREIQTQTRDLGLETYAVSLSRCSSNEVPLLPIEKYQPDADESQSLQELFSRLGDDTGRDELLRRLRRKVFISAARELGCVKVFLADTSTDLAVKVLGDVASGRGSHLSANAAFSDTRCPDIMFLRPMREFTKDDVDFYTRHYDLKAVFASEPCRKSFPRSVRNIASDFVRGLSSEFSGTVSTIYRTSEKIGERSAQSTEAERKCALCDSAILESDASSLSAVQATAFSKFVSSRGSAARAFIDSLNPTGNEDGRNGFQNSHQCTTVSRHLCYACANIFSRSRKELPLDVAPSFLRDAIREETELENLRGQIADFLL